jgi:hypothetical protein
MRILSFLVLVLLSLAGCGVELPSLPETNQIIASSPSDEPGPEPEVVEITPCSTVQDALYCRDGGVRGDRVGQLYNGAVIGLYSEFTPDNTVFNNYGRLAELGGDRGPGGGIALQVWGSGPNIDIGCAGWNSSTQVIWNIGLTVGPGTHKMYCEADGFGVRLWVDGELVATDSAGYMPTTGSLGVKMAAHSPLFDFYGTIETVIVTDRLLTNSELDYLFNN